MGLIFQSLILDISKHFEYEVVEGLRDSVKNYSSQRERSLKNDADSLTRAYFDSEIDYEGYQSHLEDSAMVLGEVNELADELCILALH